MTEYFLIGKQALLPEKFQEDEKEKLNSFLNNLTLFLNDLEKLSKSSEVKDEEIFSTLLNKLKFEYPSICDEFKDRYGEITISELNSYLEDIFGEIPDIISTAKAFIENPEINGKDIACKTYNILGRTFYSYFAGETTSGDDPEGEGYLLLKELNLIGFISKIEELTIPFSKSIHYIKNIEE